MTVHSTTLWDAAGAHVAAESHDQLTLDDLFDAEAEWAPARVRLRQRLLTERWTGVESLHWDWSRKCETLAAERLGPLGDARLMGIRAGGQWQALVWAETCDGRGVEHQTRIEPRGRNLVYVSFVEAAPWNWNVPSGPPEIGRIQRRRFKGLGAQLMEAVVRWSFQLEFRGRIGLHALPQAEDFYGRGCGMTGTGPDEEYSGLRYFEMTEAGAKRFLEIAR